MNFQQFFRHPTSKTGVTLQWNTPADPVIVHVDDMMLPAIAMSRLEGDGYQVPSPRGPVHIRIDRSTPETRFIVSLSGVTLTSGPTVSGHSISGAHPSKQSSIAVRVLAVAGVCVALMAVGIVGSVVAMKDKIGSTLNRVSITIGDAPSDPALSGTIALPDDPSNQPPPTFTSAPPAI